MFRRLSLSLLTCATVFAWSSVAHAADKGLSLTVHAGGEFVTKLTLRGAEARHQLLVTVRNADGTLRDITREAKFTVTPPSVAKVNSEGLLIATGDGSASVTAQTKDGQSALLSLTVEQFETALPINFANEIVPIFTKAGCNSGGCHGKSGGQNGFRLSLLGFEPGEDYEHLVKEARGRRVFPAAPDNSLLLTKATGMMPHGGGRRLEPDSDDYRLLHRWIAIGMPQGKPDDPTVTEIEVQPAKRVMARGGSQQVLVLAHYSDGSTKDVTRQALFEPNEAEMAKVDAAGFVQIAQQPGDVAVMVRYQGRVGTFRAMVPLGAPVNDLPPAKNYIDELVFKKLKEVGMPPSAICSDATFIRRVSIDVAGRLPTPDEVKKFVDDKSANKRDKLIDTLLASPDYADYFANKWSALLRNKRTQPNYVRGTYAFYDWIRDSLQTNKPYDQFVREILTASGDLENNPPVAWYRQLKETQNQLEDTAQLFLGMRLQCAQCHHHPFEKWSQQDYYSFSAFFSRVGRKPGALQGEEIIFHKRGTATATNPKNKQNVKPAGLGDQALDVTGDDDPRAALADWMTRPQNPFFARSLTNRYWKHFFGRGIVDPEDDMRETNPPTNPELLDALQKNFAESGYDLKKLIKEICRSSTYQLDSQPNGHNAVDRQNFSRYYPKRLNAEVLLDAVDQVTATHTRFDGMPAGTRAVQLPDNSFNATSYFLTVFGRPDSSSSCECERSGEPSLAQSLHLLNSKDVQDKVTANDGRAAKLAADKRTDEEKIRELYVWALAREPESVEIAAATDYITKKVKADEQPADNTGDKKPKKPGGAGNEATKRRAAYEDLVWALLNTKEFSFNH
jgi:hypothetical protein